MPVRHISISNDIRVLCSEQTSNERRKNSKYTAQKAGMHGTTGYPSYPIYPVFAFKCFHSVKNITYPTPTYASCTPT